MLVRLPRQLRKDLESFALTVSVERGRRVSGNELVIEALAEYLDDRQGAAGDVPPAKRDQAAPDETLARLMETPKRSRRRKDSQ